MAYHPSVNWRHTRLWSVLLALLLSPLFLAAQQVYSVDNAKAIKLYEKGRNSLYLSNIPEAVNYFEHALKLEPNFVEANLMLGDLCQDEGQLERAKQYYYAAVKKKPSFHTPAWFQLGQMELKTGNYAQAKKCYETFLKLDKKNKDKHAAAQRGLECVDFRLNALANPVPFTPQNLGGAINSEDDEYLPALTADGQTLVFTRRFPRRLTTTATTADEEDFYVSTLGDNNAWTKAKRMAEPVNSNDNEGAQCISQDGRIMIFTACGRPDGAGRCDLYMCVRNGNSWSKPRNLGPAVNTSAWESQPTLSIDGKTLYFVSDRKGGYGGMDLWMCRMVKGKWSKPVNLGPTINTPGNEMSPFIHYDDQTLYFSSDGHIGMGGQDLFLSRKLSDSTWSKPENLGYPINTGGDETNLIVSASGDKAIFSSDKLGGFGKQDLYVFALPEKARPQAVTYMKGIVTDAKTGKPLAADFKVTDLANGRVAVEAQADPVNGSFIISLPGKHNYALNVAKEGYLFHSENCELTHGTPEKPFLVNVALNKVEVGQSITLRNVFFESGRYELLNESLVELGKVVELLTNNPTLKIALAGHTDNVGKPADNQLLSERRAKAVYDYLVSQGISADRLAYKGFGETKPIADNNTEEGRAQNRRTVFTIVNK